MQNTTSKAIKNSSFLVKKLYFIGQNLLSILNLVSQILSWQHSTWVARGEAADEHLSECDQLMWIKSTPITKNVARQFSLDKVMIMLF